MKANGKLTKEEKVIVRTSIQWVKDAGGYVFQSEDKSITAACLPVEDYQGNNPVMFHVAFAYCNETDKPRRLTGIKIAIERLELDKYAILPIGVIQDIIAGY